MDIRQDNFWQTFPQVLEAITGSEYVSVDLEMTGVQFKHGPRSGKPSLEAMYEKAKEGANAFCILQFGLTCFDYDEKMKTYVTKTFNFNLTPMFPGKDETDMRLASIIDRTISFSYASLQFLRSHGFILEKAFEKGVPYLSRQEKEVAEEFFLRHPDQAENSYVDISAQAPETQEFYSDARAQILHWVKSSHLPNAGFFLNISNPYGGRLNNLQVSLIRQLVKEEFKDCRTFPRNNKDFMQVVKIGEKDFKVWKQRLSLRKNSVVRQTASRYVFEALAGGDFADEVNVDWMIDGATVRGEQNRKVKAEEIRAALKRHEAKLKRRRPVLVGHNQFYDLCFIYRTFFGELPDSIDEFGEKLHELFPRLVDTKFLGSRGDHDMIADDSLAELFEAVEDQKFPPVQQQPGYCNNRRSVAHEAGYDSWMTAVLFIKLSWKRFTDKKKLKTGSALGKDDRNYDDDGGDGPVSLRKNDYFASLDPFKSPNKLRAKAKSSPRYAKENSPSPSVVALPPTSRTLSKNSHAVPEPQAPAGAAAVKEPTKQSKKHKSGTLLSSEQVAPPQTPVLGHGLSPLAVEFMPAHKDPLLPTKMTETYASKLAGTWVEPPTILPRPFTSAASNYFAPFSPVRSIPTGSSSSQSTVSPTVTPASPKRTSPRRLLNGSAPPFVPPIMGACIPLSLGMLLPLHPPSPPFAASHPRGGSTPKRQAKKMTWTNGSAKPQQSSPKQKKPLSSPRRQPQSQATKKSTSTAVKISPTASNGGGGGGCGGDRDGERDKCGWGDEPDADRVPGWDSQFWRAYGNRVRVGRSGALNLDHGGKVAETVQK